MSVPWVVIIFMGFGVGFAQSYRPRSNAKPGSGLHPVQRYRRAFKMDAYDMPRRRR